MTVRTLRKSWLTGAAAGLALFVAACSPAAEEPGGLTPPEESGQEQAPSGSTPGAEAPGSPETPAEQPPGAAGESLPDSKEGVVRLEGTEQEITLVLFDHPQFRTYHPEDMITDAAGSDDGEAVRFIANFGGHRNDDAYLELFLFSPEISEAEAEERAGARAAAFGPAVKPTGEQRYRWSLAEYAGTVDGKTVFLAFGRHEERSFHVLFHYPSEYGDGFGPRAGLILDELVWKDTGAGLE